MLPSFFVLADRLPIVPPTAIVYDGTETALLGDLPIEYCLLSMSFLIGYLPFSRPLLILFDLGPFYWVISRYFKFLVQNKFVSFSYLLAGFLKYVQTGSALSGDLWIIPGPLQLCRRPHFSCPSTVRDHGV